MELIERFAGKALLKKSHHIELFPPAVKYFKAGGAVITADTAVDKVDHVAEARAAALAFIMG